MSRFIETIRLEKGVWSNLTFHQERFERTRYLVLGQKKHPLLKDLIRIPEGMEKGLYKCRIHYDKVVDQVLFEPYIPRRIASLKLISSDTIAYPFKFEERGVLDELFDQRDLCDDILIVRKGLLTDSYQANLVLWNGNSWHTPDIPLLPGTMRAFLLSTGRIHATRITLDSLPGYRKIGLINAMNGLYECPVIPVGALEK